MIAETEAAGQVSAFWNVQRLLTPSLFPLYTKVQMFNAFTQCTPTTELTYAQS